MVNEVTLIGNVGKDPELRHTTNNVAVCQFSLATQKSYKDAKGEWQQLTEWHNVVIWGEYGERMSKVITKGMKLYIKGELKTNKYDKDGQQHYSTKIVATGVKILDKKDKPEESAPVESHTAFDDGLPF